MIIRIVVALVVVLLGGLGYFIYWGSQPTLDEEAYDRLDEFIKLDPPTGDTMSVMTFNIGYLSGMTNNTATPADYGLFQDNLEKAVSLINVYHPNIIGLQEVDVASKRSYYQNQTDSLAIKAEYPWAFRSVNWDKRYVPFPYWPPKYHFGNVISGQSVLSDFPLSRPQKLALQRPDQPFYRDAFYLDRLLQVVDIDLGDKAIKLMNVHMEAYDEETRVLQAERVRRMYELYKDRFAILLIGDFNSSPPGAANGSKAMEVLMGAEDIRSAIDLLDYEQNPAPHYTFSSATPDRMIDFVLYNENFITKVDAKVLSEAGEISDHLPVYFEFFIHKEIGFFRQF